MGLGYHHYRCAVARFIGHDLWDYADLHGPLGNWLGLAIAKEIAVRHGASIVLGSSKALGDLSARLLFRTAKAA
jgi:hypothetical protein